jgi:hypothetical protein
MWRLLIQTVHCLAQEMRRYDVLPIELSYQHSLHHLTYPRGTTKGLLGRIVDMNQFQNSPDVQRLLQFAGSLAR